MRHHARFAVAFHGAVSLCSGCSPRHCSRAALHAFCCHSTSLAGACLAAAATTRQGEKRECVCVYVYVCVCVCVVRVVGVVILKFYTKCISVQTCSKSIVCVRTARGVVFCVGFGALNQKYKTTIMYIIFFFSFVPFFCLFFFRKQ